MCVGLSPNARVSTDETDFRLTVPVFYKSATVKRVVRSTLAAEAYAISEAVEAAQLIRYVLLELTHRHTPPEAGSVRRRSAGGADNGASSAARAVALSAVPVSGRIATLRVIESDMKSFPVTVITDSDNLAQSLRKDAGQIQDKRLRIVISMLRQTLEIESFLTIRWLPTHLMVADALTKLGLPMELLEAFLGSQKVSPKPLKSYSKEVNLTDAPLVKVGGCAVAPVDGGHPGSTNPPREGTPGWAPYLVGGPVPPRPEGEARRNSIMRTVQGNVRSVLMSGVSVRECSKHALRGVREHTGRVSHTSSFVHKHEHDHGHDVNAGLVAPQHPNHQSDRIVQEESEQHGPSLSGCPNHRRGKRVTFNIPSIVQRPWERKEGRQVRQRHSRKHAAAPRAFLRSPAICAAAMGSFLSRMSAASPPQPALQMPPSPGLVAPVEAGLWPTEEGRLTLTGELMIGVTTTFDVPLEFVILILVMLTVTGWLLLALTCLWLTCRGHSSRVACLRRHAAAVPAGTAAARHAHGRVSTEEGGQAEGVDACAGGEEQVPPVEQVPDSGDPPCPVPPRDPNGDDDGALSDDDKGLTEVRAADGGSSLRLRGARAVREGLVLPRGRWISRQRHRRSGFGNLGICQDRGAAPSPSRLSSKRWLRQGRAPSHRRWCR